MQQTNFIVHHQSFFSNFRVCRFHHKHHRKPWCIPYCTIAPKKDRENIAPDELAAFKKLAKYYGSASDAKIAALLNDEELLEICHDD